MTFNFTNADSFPCKDDSAGDQHLITGVWEHSRRSSGSAQTLLRLRRIPPLPMFPPPPLLIRSNYSGPPCPPKHCRLGTLAPRTACIRRTTCRYWGHDYRLLPVTISPLPPGADLLGWRQQQPPRMVRMLKISVRVKSGLYARSRLFVLLAGIRKNHSSDTHGQISDLTPPTGHWSSA